MTSLIGSMPLLSSMPTLQVTFHHLRSVAQCMRSSNVAAMREALPALQSVHQSYAAHEPAWGEPPQDLAGIAAFRAKVADVLRPALSKHILARAAEITPELVQVHRDDLDLVPSYVDLRIISGEAGDVLLKGAEKFMPERKDDVPSTLASQLKGSSRFKLGLGLLILNYILGAPTLAGITAVAVATDTWWLGTIVGPGIYALSWAMLGVATVLLGQEGLAYAKQRIGLSRKK